MIEKKIKLIFGKRGSGKSYLDGVLFENLDNLCAFWKLVYRKNFRIIYRPLIPMKDFDYFCDLIWNLQEKVTDKHAVTFLVEEIDCFASPYQISDEFAAIIQRGRHRYIELIGITQRPFGIPRLLTSQAKEAYIFATNEPRDIDFLRSWTSPALEEKLKSLEQYQFALWKDGSDEIEISKV